MLWINILAVGLLLGLLAVVVRSVWADLWTTPPEPEEKEEPPVVDTSKEAKVEVNGVPVEPLPAPDEIINSFWERVEGDRLVKQNKLDENFSYANSASWEGGGLPVNTDGSIGVQPLRPFGHLTGVYHTAPSVAFIQASPSAFIGGTACREGLIGPLPEPPTPVRFGSPVAPSSLELAIESEEFINKVAKIKESWDQAIKEMAAKEAKKVNVSFQVDQKTFRDNVEEIKKFSKDAAKATRSKRTYKAKTEKPNKAPKTVKAKKTKKSKK